MRAAVAVAIALGWALASPAAAATLHGLVFDDANGDGLPSAGEPAVPGAVVAFGASTFVVADAQGQYALDVPDGAKGIAWVRVPDGFTPGPVWVPVDAAVRRDNLDLPLHRLAAPVTGPLTFVVAADTHIANTQQYVTAADLANAATLATAGDPAPAFFTILGDITQGNRDAEFDLVAAALDNLGVPFIPVPGNHDWYDGGATWFRRYGPDNYSFDLGDTHFVVWNMAMTPDEIRTYLGAELARVPRTMTIVALTHAPPSVEVIEALRVLGVDYVLTGHAHSNRVVDHDGVIELNTEPLLMGGLDFTPAGYRVVTLDGGRLGTYHRTTLDTPLVSVVSPARGACAPGRGAQVIVAAELDGTSNNLTAQVDCATPIALRPAGGWTFSAELPALGRGAHTLRVSATSAAGTHVESTQLFEVCDAGAPPDVGDDWPQLGGSAGHTGTRAHEIAPPLTTRWTATVGGHVITASPVIARGVVYVAVTDLGDGATGGVVALDLATGAQRWRVPTSRAIRGGLAIADGTLLAPLIDGTLLGLDAATGALRWRQELSADVAPEAGALFAAPTADHDDLLVGHQRTVAALGARAGSMLWTDDPVPDGRDSQSAAAIAVGEGIAVGTFERALGGVIAWDRATGKRLWQVNAAATIAINASPLIDHDTVYLVSGADEVTALDLAGNPRWNVKLDPDGFDWGNATIGTPALSREILVVPTLYRDLVALDAHTGVELWRAAATPGPLRTTHYRGGHEAGFAASPVITGDLVWAADTSGQLLALELRTGRVLWRSELGVPVLAPLAASGDYLVVASYDGTVRALAPGDQHVVRAAPACDAVPLEPAGCCNTRRSPASGLMLAGLVAAVLRRRRGARAARRHSR